MSAFLVLAVGFAVAHDVFYGALKGGVVGSDFDLSSLDIRTMILDQAWSNRIGNGLAFGFKTGLSGVIALIFSACLWNTVQSKAVKTNGLDGLFAVLNDPLAFLNKDIWSAYILIVVALVSWFTPLATIVTPGTLTVKPATSATDITCRTVSGNLPNTSFPAAITEGAGFYTGPTSAMKSLATRCLVTGTFVTSNNPCGSTSCRYKTDLLAPAYQCSNHTGRSGEIPSGGPIPPKVKWEANTMDVGGVKELGVLWEGGNVTCTPYNATYKLEVSHNGTQAIKITEVIYHNAIRIEQTEWPAIDIHNTGIYNFVALLDSLNELLMGRIQLVIPASSAPRLDINSTSVADSNFASINITIADAPNLVVGDVQAGVQGLLANMSISLLALAANDPPAQSTCQSIVPINIYDYDRRSLWLSYGAALFVTVLSLAVGVQALIMNGGGHSEDFSYIIQTTRSAQLDRLAAEDEAKRDAGVEAEALAQSRLRYMFLDSDDPNGVSWAFVPESADWNANTKRSPTIE
ncbi:hypothetical protein BDZ94DRAFT_1303271 [Collybia nuda]|uniref:Uncharacterized protein n=1 Tax=Collybia nuda TaxID=64659 RepID=A0A9P6CR17_9AGAR|nr:hypothetical protein BDZ94DRAFT_1303271 [Collybia nuda]